MKSKLFALFYVFLASAFIFQVNCLAIDRPDIYSDSAGVYYPEPFGFDKEGEIIRTVPLYRFEDDVVGNFFERFIDTLATHDYHNMIMMVKLPEKDKAKVENPESYCYVASRTMWLDYFNATAGVFLLPCGEYGILLDDDQDWLAKMHLVNTNKTIDLHFGPDCRRNYEIIPDIDGINDTELNALLEVEVNGKVNPLAICQINVPIQEIKRKNFDGIFDWIETYYQMNDLPAGCDFYTYPERLKAHREQQRMNSLGLKQPSFPEN